MFDGQTLAGGVLDALSVRIAVIDAKGAILSANRAWRTRLPSNLPPCNLLDLLAAGHALGFCGGGRGLGPADAARAVAGIGAVIAGESDGFSMEYPCPGARQPAWFGMRVYPLIGDGPPRVVVAVEDVSVRHLAEVALCEERSRLRGVLDSTPDLICFKDATGQYLGCNLAVSAMLGVTPQQIVGKTDHELFSRAKAERLRALDRETIATGETRHVDVWHRFPDGRRRLFDTLGTPYRRPDGELLGVLACARDVTELHRARTLLAEAQTIAGLGSWEFDIAGCQLVWSEQTYRIFGVDPAHFQVCEDDVHLLIHPDDRDAVMNGYESSVVTGSPQDMEHRILRSDGEVRWVRQRVRHVRGVDGRPVRSFGTLLDITDEKRARRALQDSERRYRALFETSLDAMWLLDDGHGISLCNPAAARMFGFDSPAQVAQMHPAELSPELQPDGTPSADKAEIFQRVTPESGSVRFSWQHRRRGGETFPAEVSASPIQLDGGAALLVVIRDLTEQHRNEETQRRATAVFENTAEGITITDPEANIVAVNPAFTAITGYPPEMVIGKNPRILQSGIQGTDFYRDMWASLVQTGRWQGELWNRRRDGEIYPEWMSINAIRDASGALVNYVGIFSDITEARRSAEEVEYLSHHDPLTGLANGRLLRARLAQAVDTAAAQKQRIGVFYVELDHYKEVLASQGQVFGDRVLQQTGERLAAVVEPGDLVSRLSEETFVVVAEVDAGFAAASSLAARYQTSCCKPVDAPGGRTLALSVSVGVAIYPDDAADASELLRNAATALLQARQTGRRAIAFYRPEITRAAAQRLELEGALRRALEHGDFVVFFQPLVDLGTGMIRSAEALLRWRRGEEWVLPGLFIEIAEGSDLILPLGRWVLDAVLRQMRTWRDAGLPPVTVAVNIAEPQIAAGTLADDVAMLLARYKISPALLELEVIERVLLNDPEQALREIERIRALGVGVALDDFGTGYSSLSYLARFPLDCLKIDRGFITNMTHRPADAAIVRAILSMARNLGIRTVAEGVETQAQLRMLAQEGCDQVQGFLLGRPMPAEDLAALLGAGRPLMQTSDLERAPGRHLLLVIPDDSTRDALRAWMEEIGWKVFSHDATQLAMETIMQTVLVEDVAVALIDQDALEGSGIGIAEHLRLLYPDVVRILAARPGDAGVVADSINRGGVFKILIGPTDVEALRHVLDEAFEQALRLHRRPALSRIGRVVG